eukprot:TRINITY_DN6425_c0_g1_i1.p1 TRINITY_DN6425_c0_g1~~TRINITY_DN6425_c0_g1_i1.p1  ORF type:complete len:1871 (+),score=328.76 TRINITY_DN6425_c0_g1_i1:592-6204(+)
MEEGVVEPDLLLIQVRIPEINAEKCLQFQREERVWEVKQQMLAAMPKELEDSFNYGLFQPPLNGRAGKFLDEERRLAEYPFQGSVGHLELKFKRRVYKMLNLDEKQLKNINSRTNLKKFLDHVLANNVEKVNKMCNKGLDPNFHCQESGESPLSLIAGIRNRPSRMVMALVNGGAILDFRTKDGSTAMHRAVATNNIEAVRTMLELGASPNYRDSKSLTPLYHSVINSTDAVVTETLLHDHGVVGSQDLQGWQEVHQVCRNGMVQHLEHLLFYGADMNARNASGNTPLHVCAVNNQDSCARMLLFRGADKECLNYAGQTAYQVAVIAGNLELADVIQFHKPEDIVPFKEVPKFNPRRRQSGAPLARTMSDCGSFQYDTLRRVESPLTGSYILKPSSPSLSDRSLPPFSSGSSISETSTGSGGSNSTSQEEEQLDSASILNAAIADHHSDILSVSSGVGTSSNSGSGGSAATPTEREIMLIPGMTVVSLENYNSNEPSHLKISQGDVIEVTGSTDNGLLEGVLRGQTGYFPRECVEEVRLRNPESLKQNLVIVPRVPGRREIRDLTNKHFGTAIRIKCATIGQPRTCVLHKGKKGFGFVLRGAKAASPLMEMIPSDRCPSLQYMDDVDPGGVADMAGVSKGDFLLTINSDDVTQASHEQVVNLIRKSGDLVALTVVTVIVDLPTKTSNTLPNPRHFSTLPRKPVSGARSPLQHPPPPPKRDPNTTLSVGRARAKSMVANMAAIDALDSAIKDHDMSSLSDQVAKSTIEPTKAASSESSNSTSNSQLTTPTPKAETNVSPKIKNVAQELELIFKREVGLTAGAVPKDKNSMEILKNSGETKSSSANSSPSLSGKKKVYSSVSHMKRSKRGPADLLNLHKDFHSTPDLQNVVVNDVRTILEDESIPDLEEIKKEHRKSQSQEDLHLVHLNTQESNDSWMLDKDMKDNKDHPGYYTLPHKKTEKTQVDDGYRTLTRIRPVQSRSNSIPQKSSPPSEGSSTIGPAPSHPPPPPPLSHLVAVDTSSRASSDYARIGVSQEAPSFGPASSFNPASNARLYESPRDVANIGYKSPNNKPNAEVKKRSPTRTHSLPPRPTRPVVLKRAEEPETTETYSVNGVSYTTYTTFRSPITPDECESVSNRLFSENLDESAETPTTPTNEGQFNEDGNHESTPHIPEPDYDVSDVDNQSYSGSESSWRDTATLRRNQRNERDRKKKKTVSFIMNEELANIIHSSGTMTKRDSILKDPSKEKENFEEQRGRWRSTKRSPTKVSPPMPETPKTPSEPTFNSFFAQENQNKGPTTKVATVHPDWEGGSIIEPFPQTESVSKLVSTSKIRIEVGGSGNNSIQRANSQLIQKSQSFSSDINPGSQLQKTNTTAKVDNSGMISQSELQRAKLHLKSSRSFPELLEDGDNSSSGVSSDQDQDSVTLHCEPKEGNKEFVTQLMVSNGTESRVWNRLKNTENYECESNSSGTGSSQSDDLSDKTWILQSERDSLGQNIVTMQPQEKENKTKSVSLVQEKSSGAQPKHSVKNSIQSKSISKKTANSTGGHTVDSSTKSISGLNSSKSGSEPVHIEWTPAGEEHHYQNFSAMMQQHARKVNSNIALGDHVNVKRPFQSSENLMSQSFCPDSNFGAVLNSSRSKDSLMTQSLIHESTDSRSIEESLALIQHHVKGLNDAQFYGGVPPPPPSDPAPVPQVCPAPQEPDSLSSLPSFLAPPPGFSDSDHSLSDTDSLQSEPGTFRRFGFTRVSKPRSLAVPSLTEQLRKERIATQVVHQAVRKSASGILEAPPASSNLSGSVQKEFRAKSVLDWSVTDVCDWLDSLFMPEYKAAFLQNSINGYRLAALENHDWDKLGVTKSGHRLNIQKSIKRYMPKQL